MIPYVQQLLNRLGEMTMGAQPDWQETTYGDLRVGDVILPWDGEVAVTGTWTITLIGPVPLKQFVEYQTDRTPHWRRMHVAERVRIRRRYDKNELDAIIGDPTLTMAVPEVAG